MNARKGMPVKEKKQNIFITSKSKCIRNPHIVEARAIAVAV